MNVQRIDYQSGYSKLNIKTKNYNQIQFMGVSNLSKDLTLLEKLQIWFKKKVGLYDVKHEGKYIVESILTPHNLTASGDIIVIGMGANIKGVYKTSSNIEFFGKLSESGELHAKNIITYGSAKLAGKLSASKNISISGKIQESAEFNAETIVVHPNTKVKGKLNAEKIKYLEKS